MYGDSNLKYATDDSYWNWSVVKITRLKKA